MRTLAFALRLLIGIVPRSVDPGDQPALLADSLRMVEAERSRRGRLAAARLSLRIALDVAVAGIAAFAVRLNPMPPLRPVFREWRFVWRRARRARLSTGMAVALCALSVGSTVAVGGVVSAAFLSDGGIGDPERVVALYRQSGNPKIPTSAEFQFSEYEQIRAASALSGASASVYTAATCSCADAGRLIGVGLVSAEFFDVFGVRPLIGQFPAAGETDTAALSEALWRSAAFGGASSILGQHVTLEGHAFTVVGVAPASFVGPVFGVEPAVWLPIAAQPAVLPVPAPLRRFGSDLLHMRGYSWTQIWARMPDGVTATVTGERLDRELPGMSAGGRHLVAVPFETARVPPQLRTVTQQFLLILSLAVGLVVALAAAALMQLSLLRAEQALPDVALRLSLGSPVAATLALPLIDTSALVAVGGAIGVVSAPLLLKTFLVTMPATAAPLDLSVDALTWQTGLLALALLLSLALVPPLIACIRVYRRRHDMVGLLDGRRRSLTGWQGASAVAVTLQVTAGAALLGTAFVAGRLLFDAQHADVGFKAENLLVATVDLDRRNLDGGQRQAFLDLLRERLRAVPGVDGVTLATRVPFSVLERSTVFDLDPRARGAVQVDTNFVDENFFQVLGIPVVEGGAGLRVLPGAPPVVNVRHLALKAPGGKPASAGVVVDVRYWSIFGQVEPIEYVSLSEADSLPRVRAVMRVRDTSAVTVEAVRAAMAEVAPDLRGSVLRSIDDNRAVLEWVPRAITRVIVLFTAVALAVSLAGTFSVVAFAGQCRRYEFAIRSALGATATRVLGLSVSAVAWPIAIGTAAGVALAWRAAPFVASIVGAPSSAVDLTPVAGAIVCGVAALAAALLASSSSRRPLDISSLLKAD